MVGVRARSVEQWRKRLGVGPSLLAERGATDFEDREGHRAPFASVGGPRVGSDVGGVRGAPPPT